MRFVSAGRGDREDGRCPHTYIESTRNVVIDNALGLRGEEPFGWNTDTLSRGLQNFTDDLRLGLEGGMSRGTVIDLSTNILEAIDMSVPDSVREIHDEAQWRATLLAEGHQKETELDDSLPEEWKGVIKLMPSDSLETRPTST